MLQVNLTSCGEKPTAVTSEILGSVEIVELPCSECHSSQVFLKLSDVAVLALPSNKQREVMQLLRSCKSYNKDSMFWQILTNHSAHKSVWITLHHNFTNLDMAPSDAQRSPFCPQGLLHHLQQLLTVQLHTFHTSFHLEKQLDSRLRSIYNPWFGSWVKRKPPKKKVEQKKLHCRDCKHIDLYDFYLTNPLHHLRNLFQLLVDAVLEILGQVCDSLLVFWMRLVEKMLTSPPPTKKNNWQESISIQEWWKILDGLSCSHCSKIPGLIFLGEIS